MALPGFEGGPDAVQYVRIIRKLAVKLDALGMSDILFVAPDAAWDGLFSACIDETIKEKIFEPYFTTKEEGKGTGIGLYMSKMIIEENMKGKLEARNEDNGAIFSIVLDLNDVHPFCTR